MPSDPLPRLAALLEAQTPPDLDNLAPVEMVMFAAMRANTGTTEPLSYLWLGFDPDSDTPDLDRAIVYQARSPYVESVLGRLGVPLGNKIVAFRPPVLVTLRRRQGVLVLT